ncbi:ferredoxin:thioredoxin reductase [bacterium]|nr:ferredoxin:thioredoxin reductase [bacterium]
MSEDAVLEKIKRYAEKYREATGTCFSPMQQVTDAVLLGLAHNMRELGRPLCPCNYYENKQEEIKHRRWLCPCDEMQMYKYCHCLLYVDSEGLPITEHLPEGHEGLQTYGLRPDPAPDKGRALRDRSNADLMDWYK